jgi:hypothetical protein
MLVVQSANASSDSHVVGETLVKAAMHRAASDDACARVWCTSKLAHTALQTSAKDERISKKKKPDFF